MAAAATDRVVRPFEWGLEWIDEGAQTLSEAQLERWAADMVASSDDFFALPPVGGGRRLVQPGRPSSESAAAR